MHGTKSEHDGAADISASDDELDDALVVEVRAVRGALFAEAGYDLEEFGRQIRASEAAAGITSVTRRLGPREPAYAHARARRHRRR